MPNRCRVWRYFSIGYHTHTHTHRWRHLSVYNTDCWAKPYAKKKHSEFRRAGEVPSVLSAGRDLARKLQQPGETLCKVGVHTKKGADRTEFEKFLSSNSFVIWI